MPRNCKVIATCFAAREVRPEHIICGSPPGLFNHAQNFSSADSVLELIAAVLEQERTVDPGTECDTIVVNNNVGWSKGNHYLDSLNGIRTFAGHLKVTHRENFGTSLGAYNHAFEAFGSDYDYWTFTEDDILINGDRWLTCCLDALAASDDIGFVAIQGLSHDWALHAHGGVGTAHVRVLRAVQQAWGALPHRLRNESQDESGHTVFGEVLFTNIISRLGFRLITIGGATPLYEFASDYLMRQYGRRPSTQQARVVPRILRKASRIMEEWADVCDRTLTPGRS